MRKPVGWVGFKKRRSGEPGSIRDESVGGKRLGGRY